MSINVNTVQDIEKLASASMARSQEFKIYNYFYRSVAKRTLDIVFVVLALPFILPLLLIMAVLAMTDGHSPFYCQKRLGRHGRVFRMWKIRTMVHDADTLMAKYLKDNPEAREEWGRAQKLKVDPRITRVGALLRKTSLDELPQLYNVLIGEMSLVGPRPMMVSQADLYHGSSYYRLRPGITGLWQVSDRNQCDFVDRVAFDDTYDRSMSTVLDMKIIMKTFSVVCRGTGC